MFGHTFPEIKRAEDFVSSILKQEEERFKVTLDRGLKLLEEETRTLPANSTLSGEVAFKLYDTYGFPLDLTQDILKKKNIAIDNAGDLFIADTGNNAIKEIPFGSHSAITLLGTGLSLPRGVAVDSYGNVSVIDG